MERTRDPSPLVRCEVVVAIRSLVMHCESRLLEYVQTYYRDLIRELPTFSAASSNRNLRSKVFFHVLL